MEMDYLLYIVWGILCFGVGFGMHYVIRKQHDKEEMAFYHEAEADILMARKARIPDFDWGCEWCEKHCKTYEQAFARNKNPDEAMRKLDDICSRECPVLKMKEVAEEMI